MVTLSASVRWWAANAPQREAVIYKNQRISYGDLYERVTSAAGFLTQRGIGEGDVVALLMKNSAAFIELALAVNHVGGIFVPINYRLGKEEVGYILSHAEAKLVFVDGELTSSVDQAEMAVVVDEDAQCDSRGLVGESRSLETSGFRGPDDLFRLMYTSGTTDRPKGVMHTYSNFYWKCQDHISALGVSQDDRLLISGPLYHVGAFDLPGMSVVQMGGCLVVTRDFSAAEALALIESERITGAWLAPVMLDRLLTLPGNNKYDLSSFRWLVGGGERTPENRILQFKTLFTNARYIDAYGLTETCAGDTLMPPGKEIEKIGSTGTPLAHVEISILDDQGAELPRGHEGEICLRGPKVTKGYWKDAAKTEAAFFGNWFRTGDIGYVDTEGYLYLTDRKKDMIISGGENIASSEVERILFMHDAVADAAVIGLPDEKWGECVTAVVVLKPNMNLNLDALRQFCTEYLGGFKIPRRLVILDGLPRNPSGKVLKRELRAMVGE